MPPIGVGLIGLDTWASTAHLPYLLSSPNYRLVAVCNSTVASAQAAIYCHDLHSSVRAYGSSTDLAVDPTVDLVVCTCRIALHYEVMKPIIEAGKDVFVEWPLAVNLEQGEEMAALAKKEDIRTMLVKSGRIGKVLSTTLIADAANAGPVGPEQARNLTDHKTGASILTIHFAHLIDCFCVALGEFSSFRAITSTQRPTITLLRPDGSIAEADVKTDNPDQIMLQGTLASGAVGSVHMRGGLPFKDSPRLLWQSFPLAPAHSCSWKIIPRSFEIISYHGAYDFPVRIVDKDVKIEVHDPQTNEIETVDIKPAEGDEAFNVPGEGAPACLNYPARNVARLYEACSKGEKEKYADFEEALMRHKMVNEIRRSSEYGRVVRYI